MVPFCCQIHHLFEISLLSTIGARNLRAEVLDTFTTTYKLRTLKDGALVKEWPGQFTLWIEDSAAEGGYAMAQSSANEPTNDDIFELFDVSDFIHSYMVILSNIIVYHDLYL